jgi:hypothetical protein
MTTARTYRLDDVLRAPAQTLAPRCGRTYHDELAYLHSLVAKIGGKGQLPDLSDLVRAQGVDLALLTEAEVVAAAVADQVAQLYERLDTYLRALTDG